jgi:pimeloyl-ACP methyl ester carboxylesterase
MPIAAGLHYRENRLGSPLEPPLVLIHGAASHALAFPPGMRRLPGFRVITVDLPGHGRSAGAANRSIESHAASLVAFINDLGIYRVMLGGHSLGAAVALAAALLEPQRVMALALMAGAACFLLPKGMLAELAHPHTGREFWKVLQPYLFAPLAQRALVRLVMEDLQKANASVVLSDFRAVDSFDIRGELHQIKAPAWVVTGSLDRLVDPWHAKRLAEGLPHARLETIPDAGHLLMLEQPELLTSGLSAFLESLPFIKEERSHPLAH